MQNSDNAHDQLRSAVQQRFGKEIMSAKDCQTLSDTLLATGNYLSLQTLRRFFGLIDYSGTFTPNTLSVLKKYSEGGFPEDNELVDFYEDFFSIRFESEDDVNYRLISDKLTQRIVEKPYLLLALKKKIMKYPAAQRYFLEHHPLRA